MTRPGCVGASKNASDVRRLVVGLHRDFHVTTYFKRLPYDNARVLERRVIPEGRFADTMSPQSSFPLVLGADLRYSLYGCFGMSTKSDPTLPLSETMRGSGSSFCWSMSCNTRKI